MPKEIVIAIILAIIQIPIGIIGGTMPQERSKVPPISSAVSIVLILVLLVLYWQERISQNWVFYGAILLTATVVGILIFYVLRAKQSKNVRIKSKYNHNAHVAKLITGSKAESLLMLPDALQALGELDIELEFQLGRKKKSKTQLQRILNRLQKDLGMESLDKDSSEKVKRDAINQAVKELNLSYTNVNEETMTFMLHIAGVLDEEGIGIPTRREKNDKYKLVIRLQANIATKELNDAIRAYLAYSLGINSILLFCDYCPAEAIRPIREIFKKTHSELREERQATLRFILTRISELIEKELHGKSTNEL